MRVYVSQPDRPDENDPFERLRLDIVQAVAAVNLLVAKWVEPGGGHGMHLSTLLHQTLAVIRERGGARALELYSLLCGPGPFATVSEQDYAALLRAMKTAELIEQAPDAVLMLGRVGEIITDRFDFYAVFMSDEEYRIVTDQKTLGTVPVFNPLRDGDYLTFAGRRWVVLGIDDRAKVIMVKPAPAGRVPIFPAGEGMPLHDRLVEEMRSVYESDVPCGFLDTQGKMLLHEGREAYRALHLNRKALLSMGSDVFFFFWRGTRATQTLRLALACHDIQTDVYSVGLHAEHCELSKFEQALGRVVEKPPSPAQLAAQVQPLRRHKYDDHIPDDMLRDAYAQTQVDSLISWTSTPNE